MTAVTTLKAGGTVGGGTGKGYPIVYKFEIDIAAAVAAGLVTTDYVTVATIPANTFVEMLAVENATVLSLGSGPRIDVGDVGSATLWVNNSTTLTAGFDATIATNLKLYTAADEIRLKVTGGTVASGIVRFVWRETDTSRQAATGFIGNIS